MARIRAIKHGFFLHEGLARLSHAHRLLFEGLWLLADREGRLEDRPERIRAELFPYEAIAVDPMLDDLAAVDDLIVRYEVNGRRFIAVTNFAKHQRPHVRESASVIPQPPPRHNLGDPKAQPRLSGLRSPLPLQEESPLQAESKAPGAQRRSGAPAASVDALDGFNAFWSAYPKKTGKPAAEKAWRGGRLTSADLPKLLEAIEAQRRSRQWADPQYIPYPSTWLNQRRWEDEPPSPLGVVSPTLYDPAAVSARLAREAEIEAAAIERDMREIRAGGRV